MSPPESGRTQIYLDQGRYDEAAKLLREQLASSPDDVVTLLQLATCYYQDDGDEGNTKRGLEAIESALRFEPEFAPAHGLHARLLADQKKYEPALAAARQAIAIDPYDADCHGAEAVVHAKRQHWALAEEAAKRGLAIDAEDNPCSAILTHALLMQGKTAEHQEEVEYRMSRDPEDPYTHFNMGLATLRAGDHRQAEVHLKEALRLQPDFEPARQLLLEAFRSRSPVYRGFLKFSFALEQASTALPHRCRHWNLYRISRPALGSRYGSPYRRSRPHLPLARLLSLLFHRPRSGKPDHPLRPLSPPRAQRAGNPGRSLRRSACRAITLHPCRRDCRK